jgi:hypothetical protein
MRRRFDNGRRICFLEGAGRALGLCDEAASPMTMPPAVKCPRQLRYVVAWGLAVRYMLRISANMAALTEC